MVDKKKIVDARNDEKGNISDVKFAGNQKFTPIKKAIELAERDLIKDAHVVHKKDGITYLRTDPDNKTGNNLDELAGS